MLVAPDRLPVKGVTGAVKVEVPGMPRRMPITGRVPRTAEGVVTNGGMLEPTTFLDTPSAGRIRSGEPIVFLESITDIGVGVTNAVTAGPLNARSVTSLGMVEQHTVGWVVAGGDTAGPPRKDPAMTSMFRGTSVGFVFSPPLPAW